MKIDCNTYKTEKAPCKLRQQFTKCNLFGCEHPLFSYTYYATSEEKSKNYCSFYKNILRFSAKTKKVEA